MFRNDPTRPIDRVRIRVGDTSELNEFITDHWYEYYLCELEGNETLVAIEVAKAILVKFSGSTRNVVDQVEMYDNQKFEQYLVWIKEFINNPHLSGMRPPMPYAGGISKSDVQANRDNEDNNQGQIYMGFTEVCPYSDVHNTSKYNNYYN